ncbi:MAG TPA: S8 family serine peptidase, partial [Pyrinomonadaceae bacterium]|nr:S8 family serine peptidase [Pyrinomonadaceae bacterium]
MPAKLVFDERFLTPDIVTVEARKKTNDLVRVPVHNQSDRIRASELGTVAQDFGSFLLVYGSKRSLARRYGEGAQKVETTVHLPGTAFEPIAGAPALSVNNSAATRFGRGYYVVQLAGIATDDVLDSIRALGLEVLQYVPNNAFFVYGDSSSAARASAHSRVRWVGEYAPDQKIAMHLQNMTTSPDGETAMYNISVFARADLEEVASKILEASGGRLVAKMPLQSSYFNVVRVEMQAGSIGKVAGLEDIVAIDSFEAPTIEDERSSQILAGNYIDTTNIFAPGYDPLTQFGVTGTNVTVAVVDDGVSIPGSGGLYITATNTVNGPFHGATAGAEGGHGHLNASIIAGNAPFGNFDTSGYNHGVGVAPGSHIVNVPFLKDGYPLDDALAANDAVTTPGPNGVKATISNNSWGFGLNANSYESLAATYDVLSRDASFAAAIDPLLFVFSAGNSGASGLTRPKVAKNVISVGNSENLRSVRLSNGVNITANNMDDLSSSSSRGPTADGRIKPDITAPGSVITGGRAGDCSTITNCFEANHAVSSGTSHAAPQIAGAAALFTEYWKAAHSGLNPSIALTKAVILQSGQDMNGAGTASAIPNGSEGWGRANMKFMMNTGVPMKYVDQTVQFGAPGEEVIYSGAIADGSKPFRATLVWTDPPGTVDPALVNDLDLTVTIGNTVYRGNVFTGGLSATGGVADTRNNVEQVWRNGEAAGTPVTITVRSAAING